MCNTHVARHPIQCILPPHVLKSIARNGNEEQKSFALNALMADYTFRSMRSVSRDSHRSTAALSITSKGKQRTIFDADHTQSLPGKLIVTEGRDDATNDIAVIEAFNGLGATYDFYWDVFGRDSIDDDGLPLMATVHFGSNYNNAFWNGEQMVFGDGDQSIFNRFTKALDIIAHELTHGVTGDEAKLIYHNQSGAINESLSDVFGSLVKQKSLNQEADKADWLIGEGLLTDKIHGIALRSMKNPGSAFDDPVLGKDPQPGHMKKYDSTFEDNGGVHINSGIPNHAFYLLAISLGGHAWEKAGRIWYETVRDPRLRPNSGFKRFASLTVANAHKLYGGGSPEVRATNSAWKQVGVI